MRSHKHNHDDIEITTIKVSGASTIAEKRRPPMTRGVHVSLLDESTSTNLLLNESYTDCISTEYSAFENQGRSPASTNAERLKRKFHKKLAVA